MSHTVHLIFVGIACSSRRSQLEFAAMVLHNALWCGDIPGELTEDEVIEAMAGYQFRPSKLVLRRTAGQDITRY